MDKQLSVEERVANLEGRYETGYQSLHKDFDRLTREVTRLAEILRTSNKIQWGPFMAGLTILITIFGMNLAYMNKIEQQLRFSVTRLYDYHHTQEKSIRANAEGVVALENTIRRIGNGNDHSHNGSAKGVQGSR